jgi:hypothetical protein
MATDKKHIAVYLDPAVEAALVAFCEQKGLKSKKGTMFSAGVNAVLAEFFGITNTENSNIPQITDNIPAENSNISQITDNIPVENSNTLIKVGNIPVALISNIPAESIALEVLPGKLRA